MKRENLAKVEDTYLLENSWPIQGLGIVDRNILEMATLRVNVVFIFFYIQVWKINFCLSFSSMFFKGIGFSTHHDRFAVHRRARNSLNHVHKRSFPSPQHFCPCMGKSPIILTLTTSRFLSFTFFCFFLATGTSESTTLITSTTSDSDSTHMEEEPGFGLDGRPPGQLSLTATLALAGVLQSSSGLLRDEEADESTFARLQGDGSSMQIKLELAKSRELMK